MKWRLIQAGPTIDSPENYLLSNPPGFAINRGDVCGRITYMAVRLGTPWKGEPGRGWDGSQILHVERELDPTDEAARREAIGRCKEACDRVGYPVPESNPAGV